MAVAVSLRTLFLTTLALLFLAAQEDPKLEKHPISGLPRIKIPIAGETFTFEIADDSWERARGLGGQDERQPHPAGFETDAP